MLSWTIGLILLTMAILAGLFLLILVMPIVFNNLITDSNLLEKLFLKRRNENFFSALIKFKDNFMTDSLIYVLTGMTILFLLVLGLVIIMQWRYEMHNKKTFYTIFALSVIILSLLTATIILTGVWWFSFVALLIATAIFFIQNSVLKKMSEADKIDDFDDNDDFNNKMGPSLNEQFLTSSRLEQTHKNNIKVQNLEPLTKEEIHSDISNYQQESETLDFSHVINNNSSNLKVDASIPDILNPNLLKEQSVPVRTDYETKHDDLNGNKITEQPKNLEANHQINESVKQNQYANFNIGAQDNNQLVQNSYHATNQPSFKQGTYEPSVKANAHVFSYSEMQNKNIEDNYQSNEPVAQNQHVNFNSKAQDNKQSVQNSYHAMNQPSFKPQRETASYAESLKINAAAFSNKEGHPPTFEHNYQVNEPLKQRHQFQNGYTEINQNSIKPEVKNRVPNYPQNNLVYGAKKNYDRKDLATINRSMLNSELERSFGGDMVEEVIDPNKVYYHSPSTGKTIEINHKETQDLLFSDFSDKPQDLENPIYEYVPTNDQKKDESKKINKKNSNGINNNFKEKMNSGQDIEHYHQQYPNYSFANDNCPICLGN